MHPDFPTQAPVRALGITGLESVGLQVGWGQTPAFPALEPFCSPPALGENNSATELITSKSSVKLKYPKRLPLSLTSEPRDRPQAPHTYLPPPQPGQKEAGRRRPAFPWLITASIAKQTKSKYYFGNRAATPDPLHKERTSMNWEDQSEFLKRLNCHI